MKRCITCIWMTIVCAGVMLCLLVASAIVLNISFGTDFSKRNALCAGLYFGTVEPTAVILPDLHDPLQLELALHTRSYEISSKYDLKVTKDNSRNIELCILKKRFSRVSASLEVGIDQISLICDPEMRPDCPPSSIFGHYFGVSLWLPSTLSNESKMAYIFVDIDSSERHAKWLTNMTTTFNLSTLWYDMLFCHLFIKLTIAVIVLDIVIVISCLGVSVCCYSICCNHHKPKCAPVPNTPAVTYQQIVMKQEHSEELAINCQEETEGSVYKQSSEFLKEGGDKEEALLGLSRLHQDGLSKTDQDVSSSEEEIQVQLLPTSRVSSRESVCTAVSERGHRRHGCRNRFVPPRRPTVGYFTDSTSMSGAGTDVSTNDASDEDSSEDIHNQLQLSSLSAYAMVQEEATAVDTPPLFARQLTTVYEQRPGGVTTEPRLPPDGN